MNKNWVSFSFLINTLIMLNFLHFKLGLDFMDNKQPINTLINHMETARLSFDSTANQEVKIEENVRPQAIYINCFPSLLPIVIDTAREFCHKYLERCPESIVQQVLRGVSKVGENIQRAKGIRQIVAAVVYCQHFQAIRLKIKEFARINQLAPKLFNRKYMSYQNACRRELRERKEDKKWVPGDVKIEEGDCKQEQISEKEEEQQEEDNQTLERLHVLHPASVGTPKQAIELIFDGIFKTPYFQERRRQFISKMADRCQEISSQVYAQMTWTPSRPLKLFYAIYARLKQLGMNVSFTRYRETVQYAAGFEMTRKHSIAAEKIMNKLMKDRQSEDEEAGSDHNS